MVQLWSCANVESGWQACVKTPCCWPSSTCMWRDQTCRRDVGKMFREGCQGCWDLHWRYLALYPVPGVAPPFRPTTDLDTVDNRPIRCIDPSRPTHEAAWHLKKARLGSRSSPETAIALPTRGYWSLTLSDAIPTSHQQYTTQVHRSGFNIICIAFFYSNALIFIFSRSSYYFILLSISTLLPHFSSLTDRFSYRSRVSIDTGYITAFF